MEANRLLSLGGITEREALDLVSDLNPEQLYRRIGNLTLGEMDYIKKGMQRATSHYNRGAGTMERQGLQSRANKEGSEGILNHFQKQIGTDANLSSHDKKAIIAELNGINEGIEDLIGSNLDEAYLQALRSNKIVNGADLKKYMDLNKARSENIGKLKIMERADDKYQYINGRKFTVGNELGNTLEAGRQPLGGLARNVTSQILKDPSKIRNVILGINAIASQDKVKTESPPKKWNSLQDLLLYGNPGKEQN